MKHFRTALSLLLALAVTVCTGIPARAAASATAAVPVTLTVEESCRAVSVTLPASLPVTVRNGTVYTAKDAKITNNSASGSVRVTGVRVENGALTVADYGSFSGTGCIALSLNGCATRGPGELALTEKAFPAVRAGESLPLSYSAKVSSDAAAVKDLAAASVVFTVSLAG